ncbi:MAG: DUF1552 domain-containing protein [Nannocystaceae bacterium]|nr:DUF1552 domain-containing protein [Nannocystaceae bacterium]
MKPRKYLSRRTVLKGALGGGVVSLALPPLEAMMGAHGALADGSEEGPIAGVFFWANGTPWHAGHGGMQATGSDVWTPADVGAGFTPSPLIEHIATHQPSIVSGLTPHTDVPAAPPGQSDGHMRGFMVALTGDRIRPEGFDHPSHTLTALRPSLDQVVAKHPNFYGRTPPPYRSLVLGVSEARFHDYGHWNAISYNGPDSLNLPISSPNQLWSLLFDIPDDFEALERRANVLDAVLEDANTLRAKLGPRDQARLDDHLEHINEVQRRLELIGVSCEPGVQPAEPDDLMAKTQVMGELLAMALGCGITRAFSFMLTSPATTHIFSNLGVPDGMHKTCHDGYWDRVNAIAAYQMQCFSVFMDQLQAVVDPAGVSLMDRAAILGTSEYGEGWQHSVSEMPVVLAGGACGNLNRGVHVRDPGGNYSTAHVTWLRALGLPTPSFGWNGGETSDAISGILV